MAEQMVLPPILDACCGPRMMWFDGKDKRALFIDKRAEVHSIYGGSRDLVVAPDMVADFTDMPFPDSSFYLVVFDPPHLKRDGMKGDITKKYGVLPNDWKAMLGSGFSECFRVLKPYGVLIFKWADTDFPLKDILALTPHRPLFGHRRGKGTHWCVFMKDSS